MFKFLFHLITVAYIINEFMWIYDPKKQVDKTKKLVELGEEEKGESWDEYSEDYKEIWVRKGLPSLIFFAWMLLGLFTFNWILFGIHIVYGLIVARISKPLRFGKAYLAIHWVSSIIGFAFAIFVLINSYHLKIDLLELIKTWLN